MSAIKIQFISSIIILLPVSSLYHIYTIGLYIPIYCHEDLLASVSF